jgi:hypothetical protein
VAAAGRLYGRGAQLPLPHGRARHHRPARAAAADRRGAIALAHAIRRRGGQHHRRQARTHRARHALQPALAKLAVRFDALLLHTPDGPIEWIEGAFEAR